MKEFNDFLKGTLVIGAISLIIIDFSSWIAEWKKDELNEQRFSILINADVIEEIKTDVLKEKPLSYKISGIYRKNQFEVVHIKQSGNGLNEK